MASTLQKAALTRCLAMVHQQKPTVPGGATGTHNFNGGKSATHGPAMMGCTQQQLASRGAYAGPRRCLSKEPTDTPPYDGFCSIITASMNGVNHSKLLPGARCLTMMYQWQHTVLKRRNGGTKFPWMKECCTWASNDGYSTCSNVPTEGPTLSLTDVLTKSPTDKPLDNGFCSILPASMNNISY